MTKVTNKITPILFVAAASAGMVLSSDTPVAKTNTPAVKTDTPAVKAQKSLFHVKYVAHDSIYIDGGTADDLIEGLTVVLRRHPPGTAEVEAKTIGTAIIRAVATSSSVCELISTTMPLVAGDEARLSNAGEAERLRAEISKGSRKYLQVVEFDGKDPLEDEQRAYVPKPHESEVARMRGSFSIDRSQINDHDSSSSSAQNGASVRVDWARMGGSYWNLIGYWRGSVSNSTSSQASTLLDLMNRTYQIGLFYSNPDSDWNLGIGRLFVPGATSLGVFDGGYVTRKLSANVRAGLFAGTSPDPTQWNFAPNRQTAGTFLRIDKGEWDTAHWTGTVGLALTRINWRPERQYLFTENTFSIGRVFTFYQNAQADQRNPKLMNGQTGAQLSQSFATIRLQPHKRIGFDLNHNYFRGVPTFDQRLLGTGLLDQYLFTGFSGGVHLDPLQQLMITANVGQSRKNGDTSHSLNQYYGIAWKRLPWVNVRLDARYTKFRSSFGDGEYRSLSVSRTMFDNVRLQFEGGVQQIHSGFASQGKAHYLNTTADWPFARHYFISGGWLYYRGHSQNYDELYTSLGYRFR